MDKIIQPMISISLKKPLIRIYKSTLHLIGTPTHVLLMINPNEKTLVIHPSDKSDLKAHYVAKYLAKNKKSIELYSTSLIKQLKCLCPNLEDGQAYKFFGKYIPTDGIVEFNMQGATLITK